MNTEMLDVDTSRRRIVDLTSQVRDFCAAHGVIPQVEMISGDPPRSAIPTANDTRVRVDDLSKITATVCGPASG